MLQPNPDGQHTLSRNQKRKQRNRSGSNEISEDELMQLLAEELTGLTFSMPDGAVKRFAQFINLLHKWNAVYNLTSVRDMKQMVSRHIMDSVVIAPYLQGEQILDVGCGAGLPGIPLAITEPQRHYTLLDSNNKKTRFVQQSIAELHLTNVSVVTERIEIYQPSQTFDTVVARAYSSIENLLNGVRHLLKPGSQVLAMKGIYPLAELESIPASFTLERVEPVLVPGLEAERHLVMLKYHADPE